jgi:hypothetical protein
MPTRPNRTSGCFKRFAARESLTVDQTIAGAFAALPAEIKKRSIPCHQFYGFGGGIIVLDGLVFEFMGLAVLALCVVVLAIPSQRRPGRHARDA